MLFWIIYWKYFAENSEAINETCSNELSKEIREEISKDLRKLVAGGFSKGIFGAPLKGIRRRFYKTMSLMDFWDKFRNFGGNSERNYESMEKFPNDFPEKSPKSFLA